MKPTAAPHVWPYPHRTLGEIKSARDVVGRRCGYNAEDPGMQQIAPTVWCGQCGVRVQRGCSSKFCRIVTDLLTNAPIVVGRRA